MENNNEFVCSICGNKFTGFGNNPWPVTTGDNDRCCNACDDFLVLPARLARMFGGKKDE